MKGFRYAADSHSGTDSYRGAERASERERQRRERERTSESLKSQTMLAMVA